MDRLSELENNINNLMQNKRSKEQSRGYVGQPIAKAVTPNPTTYRQKTRTFQEKVATPNRWQSER